MANERNDLAYILTKDLKAVFFPNSSMENTDTLKEFPEPRELNLKNIFNQRFSFFKELSIRDDYNGNYTQIEVRAILTDESRQNMELVYDGTNNSVDLFGGPLNKSDYVYNPYEDFESMIIGCLTRNILIQDNPIYGEDTYNSMKYVQLSTAECRLKDIIYLKCSSEYEMLQKLYYSYKLPYYEGIPKLILYYVFERKDNSGLSRNLVTLNKELFRISLRSCRKRDIGSLLGYDGIKDGLVYTDAGRAQLQAIFQTRSIF